MSLNADYLPVKTLELVGYGPINATDVMLLGAGFSRAATCGEAPLMHDFFHQLDEDKYWSLTRFLHRCFENPCDANAETVLVTLDQLAHSPLGRIDTFMDECGSRNAEVRREFNRYCIDRLKKLGPDYSAFMPYVLAASGEHTTVITTNYDNVAEQVLSNREGMKHGVWDTNCPHCRMVRILEYGCRCDLPDSQGVSDGNGTLLKLHGSVAWRICRNAQCDKCDCIVPDPGCRPFEGAGCDMCKGECDPVIVPPSMNKEYDAFEEISRLWLAAAKALRAAESLIMIGFSMPHTDAVIAQLLRCTIGSAKKLRRVAVLDIDPTSPSRRLLETVGDWAHEQVAVNRFVVPIDGADPEWLRHI